MLLLQSTTELINTVKVVLEYDDNTSKEIVITTGTYMILKYRYNGNKDIDVVKVNKVKVIFKPSTLVQYEFDGAILVLDIAKEFSSKRIQLRTDDILNAKIITEEEAIKLHEEWDTIEKTDQLFEPDATRPDDDTEIDPGFSIDDENIDTPPGETDQDNKDTDNGGNNTNSENEPENPNSGAGSDD